MKTLYEFNELLPYAGTRVKVIGYKTVGRTGSVENIIVKLSVRCNWTNVEIEASVVNTDGSVNSFVKSGDFDYRSRCASTFDKLVPEERKNEIEKRTEEDLKTLESIVFNIFPEGENVQVIND